MFMKSIAYMNRVKAAAIALTAGFFLGSYVPPAPLVSPPAVEETNLRFIPVALIGERPEQRSLGPLTFIAGWQIEADNRRFGGISAMHVEAGNVVAMSDAGTVISFALPQGAAGRARLETLLHGPGPATDKSARDSESLLFEAGQAWSAVENRNAVWRYARGSWRPQAAARPPAMRRWSANSGSEALVRLQDGRFLIMAESTREDNGTSGALLFEDDPAVPGARATPFRYRPPAGQRVTDAAVLPDGRLLVLHRSIGLWSGITASLSLLRLPPRLGEDAILEGTLLARFEPPVTTDNYEALSVTQEQGRTIVWIASDDNFYWMQRTLLMRFALAL